MGLQNFAQAIKINVSSVFEARITRVKYKCECTCARVCVCVCVCVFVFKCECICVCGKKIAKLLSEINPQNGKLCLCLLE